MGHYACFTGGRETKGPEVESAIRDVLNFMRMFYGKDLGVMHGDCRGADKTVGAVAQELGIKVKAFPADWNGVGGKKAGFERNAYMAGLLVDWENRGHSVEVIALPGGRGTEMMCSLAEKSGLNVTRIPLEGHGLQAS